MSDDLRVAAGQTRAIPARGTQQFSVRSACVRGEQTVEVLLPTRCDPSRRYRVLYVLPVNPGLGGRWGDGLQVLRATGLHDHYGLIAVTMTFARDPWYGAHATDPALRQEAYVRDVVVPLVDERYPVLPGPAGRLLLGFSKSGWGSVCLLLRNPDVFGCAVSWDAPLLLDADDFHLWALAEVFGTREQFLAYRPTVAAEATADRFRDRPRLAILGHQAFGNREGCPPSTTHTVGFHEHLTALGIPHTFHDAILAEHSWHADWLTPAVHHLLALA